MAEQEKAAEPRAAEAEAIDLGEFSDLLEKDFRVKKDDSERLQSLVRNLALAARARSETHRDLVERDQVDQVADRRHRQDADRRR